MAGDDNQSVAKQPAANQPMTGPAIKVFQCPQCGAGVTIRALGQSVTAVCGSCAAIIDSTNENYKVIASSAKEGKRRQVIPLGQRGKFRGTKWEVIGYVERHDSSAVYVWSEYLLFNPMSGFRWLTEFDGHWNYVITVKGKPQTTDLRRPQASYLNKTYKLFNRGTATTSFVRGEFYWQVKQGEAVTVDDYVNPPEILSCEKSDQELIWSLGQYVPADEVGQAFQVKDILPVAFGVAPNQPSRVAESSQSILKLGSSFLGILIFLQLGFLATARKEVVFNGQFVFGPFDTDKVKVTPQFELKGSMANLKVEISSPVQNNWLEIQSDLVNDESGETQEFEQGVEFYSGSDYDGYWSEGSRSSDVLISSVAGGKYHLNLEASGPSLPTGVYLPPPSVVTAPGAVFKEDKWPSGKLKSSEPMVNGKIEGMAKYFHENGQVYGEIPYFNGSKHGKFKLYRADGSLEQELSYLEGKLHGTSKWYDENGNLNKSANYVEDKLLADDTKNGLPVGLTITRDVPTWSNFWWAVLLVSIAPVIVWWRNRSFETSRWSQSDFSPYYQHREED